MGGAAELRVARKLHLEVVEVGRERGREEGKEGEGGRGRGVTVLTKLCAF